MRSYFAYSATLAFCLATGVVAQEAIDSEDILGLDLDSLLTDKGRWKFELTSQYTHTSEDNISIGFVSISDGLGGSIDVPVDVGFGNTASDILVVNAGLRYGLTPKTEVLTRTSFTTSLGFTGLSVGFNHHFREANDKLGVIGFANIDALTKQLDGGFIYGKSGVFGLTLYQVYDPVVLSFTSGYRPRFERNINNVSIDPGDTFYINPNVAFAVNNDITLTGGISVDITGSDYIENEKISGHSTQSQIDFSVARSLDDDVSVRFDASIGIVGSDTVSLGLIWTQEIGQ